MLPSKTNQSQSISRIAATRAVAYTLSRKNRCVRSIHYNSVITQITEILDSLLETSQPIPMEDDYSIPLDYEPIEEAIDHA